MEGSNRDAQTLIVVAVLTVALIYAGYFHWVPRVKVAIAHHFEKKRILTEIGVELKTKTVGSNDENVANSRTINSTLPVDTTDTYPRFRLNVERHLKKIVTQQDTVDPISDTKPPPCVVPPGPKFTMSAGTHPSSTLRGEQDRSDNNGSSNVDAFDHAAKVPSAAAPQLSSDSYTTNTSTTTKKAVNPSHFSPPPQIVLTPAEVQLQRERKLKEQQNAAFAASVLADTERIEAEQAAEQARLDRIARLQAIVDNPRVIETSDDTVKLSFQYKASPSSSAVNTQHQPPAATSGAEKKKQPPLTATFYTHDSVAYLLDFCEAHYRDAEGTNSAASSSHNRVRNVECSLSYPVRVVNRSTEPTLSLQDVGIKEDSVVWVTFRDE